MAIITDCVIMSSFDEDDDTVIVQMNITFFIGF